MWTDASIFLKQTCRNLRTESYQILSHVYDAYLRAIFQKQLQYLTSPSAV